MHRQRILFSHFLGHKPNRGKTTSECSHHHLDAPFYYFVAAYILIVSLTMGNNYSNDWGKTLCIHSNACWSQSSNILFNGQLDGSFMQFSNLINKTFRGKNQLQTVCQNGSDANLAAINYATDTNCEQLLVACGCYVAGSNSSIAFLSTSTFNPCNGPCLPIWPTFENNEIIKMHVIGLPYHIPNDKVNKKELGQYKEDILNQFHIHLLYQKPLSKPIKALLMELILAGCGGKLSPLQTHLVQKLPMVIVEMRKPVNEKITEINRLLRDNKNTQSWYHHTIRPR